MRFTRIWMGLVVIALTGCTSVKRLPPPKNLNHLGQIPGIPEIRIWGDDAQLIKTNELTAIREVIRSDPTYDPEAPVHFLAISGGGQKGAFGAGILAGWTASGTRPEFRMVTGISTGALIAPFAFLGSEYDSAITAMYSKFSTKDVLKTRYVSALFGGDSITDNSPLRDIVKKYFTPVEMKKVAEAYKRGRWLLVGTTYLDVQRPVIWNIGEIALSNHPDAYDLIIDVLLASTAVPGVFPPVYFQVEQGGTRYDELHVDGGVTTQIFVSPVSFDMEDALNQAGFHGDAHVYLIRNAQLAPSVEHLEPRTLPILTQSMTTLLRAQGLGDMYRIYLNAKLNGMHYHAAYMPDGFRKEPEELFDINYMNDLYSLAFEEAKNGYPWEEQPPKFKNVIQEKPE